MKTSFYIFITAVFFLGFLSVSAQDKAPKQVTIETRFLDNPNFYAKLDLGFSMGIHPAILYQSELTTGSESSSSTTTAIKANLGTGLPFAITAGYRFNDHYAVELSIDYFKGLRTSKTDTRTNGNGSSTVTDEATTKVSAGMLSITPSFVMSTNCGPVRPYARLGVEIGVSNNYYSIMTGANYMFKSTPQGDMLTRDYGGIAVGIRGAMGVEYPINKMISVFGEIQARAISFSPKHGKVTKYTVDGEDRLSTLTTRESKWDYVKSVTNPNSLTSDDPAQYLRVTHSVSGAILAVGVKINFIK
jgi:opacity protein-like surface antigen